MWLHSNSEAMLPPESALDSSPQYIVILEYAPI